MTRKKAIEIVVETAKKCSWVPKGWKYAAAAVPGKRHGSMSRALGFWIKHKDNFEEADPTFGNGCANSRNNDGGWYFTRKWLEEKGYL